MSISLVMTVKWMKKKRMVGDGGRESGNISQVWASRYDDLGTRQVQLGNCREG
jgi:hypothetical protein